jgi:serine/threonine-protein kinase HipA
VTLKRLAVSLPGCSVGVLTQSREGLTQFRPDAEWEREQQPRLGLEFLRSPGTSMHASELPAWFDNLLPERGSELRARLCTLYSLRDGQSYALMRALGGDLIGAVEVREPRLSPAPLGDGLSADEDVGDASVPHPSEFETKAAQMNGVEHMSALTGIQLKFSMSMVNERLFLPARSGQTEWIIKIAGQDYDELAEVETATMTWARHAGFDVPPHAIVPVSHLEGIPPGWVERPAPAFAVRRFDRRDDGTKVHQEDLCQALGLSSREKYGDGLSRVTFDGALRLVVDVCGEADGREMARRIGFMIASGNTDAHLKNWSLLWCDRTRPTLTPCYDLVATIAWERMGWQRTGGPELALSIGGVKHFRLLDNVAIEQCCAKVNATWVKEEILSGIDRARTAWPALRESTPKRMQDAIDRHWRSVPVLAPS